MLPKTSVSELLVRCVLSLTLSCRHRRLGSLQRESAHLARVEEALVADCSLMHLLNSTLSTSTASTDGSRRVMSALWVSPPLFPLASDFRELTSLRSFADNRVRDLLPSANVDVTPTDLFHLLQEWELQKYGR